jgi:HAMP domain-containing protein
MREALSGAQRSLGERGIGLVAVTSLDGVVLAGWEGDDAVLAPDVSSVADGLGDLIDRARDVAGPVLGTAGDSADLRRVAASVIRVRGEPVAAVVVGAPATFPLGAFPASLLVAFFLLGLGVAVVWFASRALVREQQRLHDETLRVSRGDLGRPVTHSERFPETVQALERIRVSLQEGLERLRRRRR